MAYPYRHAPGTEVSGAVMSAIFNHYQRDDVIESLQKHGLDYFEADQWYPVDQFINLLAEWSESPAFSTNLVSIGMAMTYHIELPDEIEALSGLEKLMLLGDMHMGQHRSGDAGCYRVERIGESAIRYTENTVWPDDMIYGYIYGAARRYLDRGVHFSVRYVKDAERQDTGGGSTTFDLIWELQ